jgi:hypothetical protein
MASFVVMEPPVGTGMEAAERTVFVRDGFSFLALIVPVFWLLFHRLWFEAGLVLATSVALGLAGQHWDMSGAAIFLSFLVSVLVSLEGNNWRVTALRRRGYVEKGVIEAADRSEAETRYFTGRDFQDETPASPRKKRAARPAQPKPDARLGLVGFSGEN